MLLKLRDQTLVIASHNAGKISEISGFLDAHGIKNISAAALNLQEPEENGTTYLQNALIKAKACITATNLPTLADDSGIEVEALSMMPGVDTAPYTKKRGGRKHVFSLWQADRNIRENPKATFICVQVLMWPDGRYENFFASVHGKLSFPARGNYGHGYDPIFIPDGHTLTMAQMTFDERIIYSHRFKALKNLILSA